MSLETLEKTRKYLRNCSACGGEHNIEFEKVTLDLKLEGDSVTYVGVCPKEKRVIFIVKSF